MKNAMFQFASSTELFENTDLITLEDAKEMFKANRVKFISELEMGRNPEMCIWINCETKTSYKQTEEHWCAEDMMYTDGQLWQVV